MERARRDGRIEGAYWAIVTHPLTRESCLQHVFGELHMLSHLVGVTNRADIRRLKEIESEIASLRAALDEVKSAMRAGFSQRDTQIQQLRRALASTVHDRSDPVPAERGSSCVAPRTRGTAATVRSRDRARGAVSDIGREGRQREQALQTRLEGAEELGRQLGKGPAVAEVVSAADA